MIYVLQWALLLVLSGWLLESRAQEYVPASDSEVVAELPPAVVSLASNVRQGAAARSTQATGLLLQEIVDSYRLADADN